MVTPTTEPLTFVTTLIGDTVRIGADEFEVVQKYPTERRLVVVPAAGGDWQRRERSISEYEYNLARPELVKGKGKA